MQMREDAKVERRIINPWTWQDQYGYVQAHEVRGVQRTLYCSGQGANDAEGNAVYANDMRAQITLALDNLEAVLRASGYTFADIVRLNIYVTDVDQFFAQYDAFISRLAEAGCRHTGSLIGVARLAFPEMMIEIEATAVA
jgi:enamine deaminase RidA (YjgF/YER057c/UK114 family)